MKPSAYLINCGRGAIVKEDDLYNILKENVIAGAGIDVFENEPLDISSELWQFDNIIITPHNSWVSDKNNERTFNMIYDNLRSYIQNKPLKNNVDIYKGY